MTIPKETMIQAALLVEAGVIPAEVARMVGISVTSVINACKELNIDYKQAKLGRKTKFETALVDLCKRLKRKGMYAKEIAKQVNETTEWEITATQVGSITKDVKRSKRDTVKPSKFVETKVKPASDRNLQIFEMWCEYKTLEEVGTVFDITRERVRQIVNDLETKHDMVRPPKPPTIAVCAHCGVEWHKQTRPESRYCSNECGRRAISVANTKPDSKWSRSGVITLTCAECKATFEKSNYDNTQMKRVYEMRGLEAPKHRFCSRACNLKFQRRIG